MISRPFLSTSFPIGLSLALIGVLGGCSSSKTASGSGGAPMGSGGAGGTIAGSGGASSGTGGASVAESKRPQLSKEQADSLYTIRQVLAQGGTISLLPPTTSGAAGGSAGAAGQSCGVGGAAGATAGGASGEVGGTAGTAGAGGEAGGAVFAAADGDTGGSGGVAGGGAGGTAGGGHTPTPVFYSLMDNWDPVSNGIGDTATFTATFTVATDGSGTHKTIAAAVADAVLQPSCARVYIRLFPGTYREQVNVISKASAPPITIYSTETDASKTVIVESKAAPTVGNTSASATLTVKALSGFQMKNLTVANDYVVDSASGTNQSAVAFLNQSDKSQFENVRVLGHIGTLYIKSVSTIAAARSYFRDCYVEGDMDFITGRGVAVFDHSEIKYLSKRLPTGGIIAAPSTPLLLRYGFLFDNCQFTSEAGANGISLGHQWQEGGQTEAVGKMIVRNCTLGAHVSSTTTWSSVGARTTSPKNPNGTAPLILYSSDDYFPSDTAPIPTETYLGEYGNTGPGAKP